MKTPIEMEDYWNIDTGNFLQWNLGTCSSTENTQYEQNTMYLERCCTEPGKKVLTCRNKHNPDGWKEGFIEIQGHRYCDDFVAFKGMRQVMIEGMHQ